MKENWINSSLISKGSHKIKEEGTISQPSRGNQRRRDDEGNHERGEILVALVDNIPTQERNHAIAKGDTISNCSSLAQKVYAHQALHVDTMSRVKKDEKRIEFTPEGQGDVLIPHDDPLVILVVISKHHIE